MCSIQPILIIGAPRSGTKIFRETLHLHPDIVGPKYELERIWCYKNMHRYNMPLGVERLTPEIANYIRNFFNRLAKKNTGRRIAAKSTILPLRIPFIRSVFPLAPIIHIVRDGRDSACSIMERKKEPLEMGYLLKHKAYPPLIEIPYYLSYFIKCQYEKIILRQKYVKTWGPQFDDMHRLYERYSLIEVCGIQWLRSVMGVYDSFNLLNKGPFLQIHYEQFVHRHVSTMEQVLDFLNLSKRSDVLETMKRSVTKGRIGRWQFVLSQKDQDVLVSQIKEGLTAFGYL